MDEFVVMKFTGTSVDLLCKMNPKYLAYVTIEAGEKVLYVSLDKAIYGCVKSAILWYHVLYDGLGDIGFEANPYDPCVANCQIEGTQCTIAWYVDDMKISHVNPEVVSSIIAKIEGKFGKMTVTRGNEHVFLGMHIRYTDKRTAVISMRSYLEEALVESGLDIPNTVVTPATRNLFDVDESAKPLPKSDADVFHSSGSQKLESGSESESGNFSMSHTYV
jgi:Reverse transcriptase (RNA-dependent DNA polymerase)